MASRRVISLPAFYCWGGCNVAKLWSPRLPQHPFQPQQGGRCKGRAAKGRETWCAERMAARMRMLHKGAGLLQPGKPTLHLQGPSPTPPCTPEGSHRDQHREGQPQSPGSFPLTAAG